MDDHDNVWVNAYNDVSELVMAKHNEEKFPADYFVQLNEEELQERLKSLKYKKIKAKIVSAYEEYNGDQRIKHKLIKMLPIKYEEENKILLEDIKSILNSI